MRRTLFCLLIVLTALRGMVGNVMAVEMAHMQGQASADMSHKSQAPMQQAAFPPCHDAAADTADHAAHTSPECTACQVCHSPALQRLPALPELGKPVAGFAALCTSEWMSADLIRLQKPPIS